MDAAKGHNHQTRDILATFNTTKKKTPGRESTYKLYDLNDDEITVRQAENIFKQKGSIKLKEFRRLSPSNPNDSSSNQLTIASETIIKNPKELKSYYKIEQPKPNKPFKEPVPADPFDKPTSGSSLERIGQKFEYFESSSQKYMMILKNPDDETEIISPYTAAKRLSEGKTVKLVYNKLTESFGEKELKYEKEITISTVNELNKLLANYKKNLFPGRDNHHHHGENNPPRPAK